MGRGSGAVFVWEKPSLPHGVLEVFPREGARAHGVAALSWVAAQIPCLIEGSKTSLTPPTVYPKNGSVYSKLIKSPSMA